MDRRSARLDAAGIAAVPEPSTWIMLATGSAVLVGCGLKRRSLPCGQSASQESLGRVQTSLNVQVVGRTEAAEHGESAGNEKSTAVISRPLHFLAGGSTQMSPAIFTSSATAITPPSLE